MTDGERYERAARAMQTGVAAEIGAGVSRETEPKHLRVGVNAAMCDSAALAKLLVAKGLITTDEYIKAIADQMEEEALSYEKRINERLGANGRVKLR